MELYQRIKKIWKKLETDDNIKEETREIFSKVKKDFPYIKQEIEIKYESFFEIGFCISPGGSYSDGSPAFFVHETSPNQVIANMFFKAYTREEKGAIIAHELGHYGQPSDDDYDYKKTLCRQIEADSKAAEAGYGKTLLNILNKFKKRSFLERQIKDYETRIRSLEQKLEQLANGEETHKPENI